jgi:hypothetical protein
MSDGVKRADYLQASTSRWMAVEGEVIEEAPLTLYVNG